MHCNFTYLPDVVLHNKLEDVLYLILDITEDNE